jgi:hypothetical protein
MRIFSQKKNPEFRSDIQKCMVGGDAISLVNGAKPIFLDPPSTAAETATLLLPTVATRIAMWTNEELEAEEAEIVAPGIMTTAEEEGEEEEEEEGAGQDQGREGPGKRGIQQT